MPVRPSVHCNVQHATSALGAGQAPAGAPSETRRPHSEGPCCRSHSQSVSGLSFFCDIAKSSDAAVGLRSQLLSVTKQQYSCNHQGSCSVPGRSGSQLSSGVRSSSQHWSFELSATAPCWLRGMWLFATSWASPSCVAHVGVAYSRHHGSNLDKQKTQSTPSSNRDVLLEVFGRYVALPTAVLESLYTYIQKAARERNMCAWQAALSKCWLFALSTRSVILLHAVTTRGMLFVLLIAFCLGGRHIVCCS